MGARAAGCGRSEEGAHEEREWERGQQAAGAQERERTRPLKREWANRKRERRRGVAGECSGAHSRGLQYCGSLLQAAVEGVDALQAQQAQRHQ